MFKGWRWRRQLLRHFNHIHSQQSLPISVICVHWSNETTPGWSISGLRLSIVILCGMKWKQWRQGLNQQWGLPLRWPMTSRKSLHSRTAGYEIGYRTFISHTYKQENNFLLFFFGRRSEIYNNPQLIAQTFQTKRNHKLVTWVADCTLWAVARLPVEVGTMVRFPTASSLKIPHPELESEVLEHTHCVLHIIWIMKFSSKGHLYTNTARDRWARMRYSTGTTSSIANLGCPMPIKAAVDTEYVGRDRDLEQKNRVDSEVIVQFRQQCLIIPQEADKWPW